jgi:hypothetical protein
VRDSMEETYRSEELTLEELEAQHIELLPDREEMNVTSGEFTLVGIGNIAAAQQGAQAVAGQGNAGVFFNA